MATRAKALIDPILHDDALTHRLGDAEARVLIEWLVEQAERLALAGPQEDAEGAVRRLCRRGRTLACFVSLWGRPGGRPAAVQLAACAGLSRALPAGEVDPCELMQEVLSLEERYLRRAA